MSTARYGGLDWQLKLLAKQTLKDFEVIIIDGCWETREDKIKKLAEDLNLNIQYFHEEFPFKTSHVRPINGNRKIAHMTGDCIVFLDDYHVFPKNYLEEHYRMFELGYAGICRWDNIKYMGDIDYSEVTEFEILFEDVRYKPCIEHYPDIGYPIWCETAIHGIHINNIPWDWWWPSSSCVPRKYIYDINGYNEMYCGGTSGEDNDAAYRMHSLELKFAYNPNIIIYHINHGKAFPKDGGRPSKEIIPMRALPHRTAAQNLPKCEFRHSMRPFVKNEYWPHGDPDLIENDQLFTWYQDGYKLFQCKHCGEFGCVDGQQMLANTKKRIKAGIYTSPEKIVFPEGTAYNCTNLRK